MDVISEAAYILLVIVPQISRYFLQKCVSVCWCWKSFFFSQRTFGVLKEHKPNNADAHPLDLTTF